MGDDYQPSERVEAALTELQQALTEDDVAGFSLLQFEIQRSFAFNSPSAEGAPYITVDPKTGDKKGGGHVVGDQPFKF